MYEIQSLWYNSIILYPPPKKKYNSYIMEWLLLNIMNEAWCKVGYGQSVVILHRDASCLVWWKLAQWFSKRRRKCEKITTTNTTTMMMKKDNGQILIRKYYFNLGLRWTKHILDYQLSFPLFSCVYTMRLFYLRSSQYFPFHPWIHPVSHIPLRLLQPAHVLLQVSEQASPKNPKGHP